MQESRPDAWLQILASLGVFLGLLLVGFELRELNRFASSEESLTVSDYFFEYSMSEYQSDLYELLLKSAEKPDEMTSADIMKLSSYMTMQVSLYEQWFNANGMDTMHRDSLDSLRENTNFYFGSKFGRAWFAENMNAMRPEIAEAISGELAATPEWTVPQYIENIKSRL